MCPATKSTPSKVMAILPIKTDVQGSAGATPVETVKRILTNLPGTAQQPPRREEYLDFIFLRSVHTVQRYRMRHTPVLVSDERLYRHRHPRELSDRVI